MLALMPLVDPVLATLGVTLGVTEEYVSRSVELRRYQIRSRLGAPLREYTMTRLLKQFGDYRGISRGELIEVLGSRGGPVTYRTTVRSLEQRADVVRATLDVESDAGATQTDGDFDLVVTDDGLHSTTRDLVLGPDQVTTFDTGWGGWVGWIEPDDVTDLGEELWGPGCSSAPIR